MLVLRLLLLSASVSVTRADEPQQCHTGLKDDGDHASCDGFCNANYANTHW